MDELLRFDPFRLSRVRVGPQANGDSLGIPDGLGRARSWG